MTDNATHTPKTILSARDSKFELCTARAIGLGESKFQKALTKQYGNDQGPDRVFEGEMSVDPDVLQRLVDEFRKVRMDYKEAYET
jgi:hypothetical protein